MTDITTALQEVSGRDIRDIALRSYDPLEALYRVNPEIATLAYAHKEELLNSQLLPYVTRFRELQSDERIALVQGLVEKYRIDVFGDVAKYRVDGNVRMTQIQEGGETARTEMIQGGLTRRTEITEEGLTQRERVKFQGLFDLQKLEYESRVQMLRDHIEGQKYLSDNQLKAVYAEAEAYKYAIESRERIRAEARMQISRDRLEGKVKLATIEFAQKIKEAEIHRNTARDKNRARVILSYIQSQTQLCLEAFQKQVEIEVADRKLEEKRLEVRRDVHNSFQKSVREGMGIIRESVVRGRKQAKFIIDFGNSKIILDYSSSD